VTYDLYFWPAGTAVDAGSAETMARRLARERVDGLRADPRVVAFRAEVLRRWPELADRIEPWHGDLGWRQAWGRTDVADRYVILTVAHGWPGIAALAIVAGAYGLDTYDPQRGQVTVPRDGAEGAGVPDVIGRVAGEVAEDGLVRALKAISADIGYRYDDLDEAALSGALDGTDAGADEEGGGWFEYPLGGEPLLTVRLARVADRDAVAVRVDGAMPLELAARVEAVIARSP
jgi:hypothetical protein